MFNILNQLSQLFFIINKKPRFGHSPYQVSSFCNLHLCEIGVTVNLGSKIAPVVSYPWFLNAGALLYI